MRAQKDMVGDERMRAATGRSPEEWFVLLDAQRAQEWTHTAIAEWLRTTHAVESWWSQGITVRYEQARGMRVPGQKADGTFTAVVTKTVRGDAGEVLNRAIPVLERARGAEATSINRAAKTPTARWTLAGRERLLLTATPGSEGRVSVGLAHSGIVAEAAAAEAKIALATLLERIEMAVVAPES